MTEMDGQQWHQQQLEQQQIEEEMDFHAFLEIITRRIKSKLRRKQLLKLYTENNDGTNIGDC
jgi:hypothetical protein